MVEGWSRLTRCLPRAFACLTGGNDQHKEYERPADGLAELTREAMDLIVNLRVRWFRQSCFWRATASPAARGVETLLATHWIIATSTCRDVRDTDVE
ncbi:conserved hypothetical protein [Xanthomonas citri pv. fuscans]|nr:conserved hypothetical protein [Xanthomonas citri pv. fuscans]SON98547.1 conserved hypothetical protein [Xanthomonas citri pv. fuscans]SOO05274.1 conserved hypothetical protein [Xanthomonas citri pv. fuscans]SOO08976.1 conserved hypothetical protein [Xanthomonas citri pv. fuscans]SOO14567.1 conserved hypothetical protein [Xanthomonas citri pv. fuscans]